MNLRRCCLPPRPVLLWAMSEREIPSMSLDDYTLPELGCHTVFARNVRHDVDVQAVWHVSRVVSPRFWMCSPMSIDAGCGGSCVGPHSCFTTWGTSGAHKGIWSPIHWSGVSRISPGYPGVVVLAPLPLFICITVVVLGGACFCTNLPWCTNLRNCCLPPRPVGNSKDALKE